MVSDPCSTIQSLLEAGWTATNTDGRKPLIFTSASKKQIDFSRQDAVKLYVPTGTSYEKNGIGRGSRRRVQAVTVDLFTSESLDHYYKMETEVVRVLGSSILNPDGNFHLLDPDGTFTKVDFYPGHYHSAIDVKLIVKTEART